jgi:HPt (histidine-containing phosphotransfer) domain-containing protein
MALAKLNLVTMQEGTPKQVRLDYLREISGNNPELIKEFIQEALGQSDQIMPEINQALALHDFDKVSRLCHMLKSSMKIFHSDLLVELLSSLEVHASDDSQHIHVTPLGVRLNELMAGWKSELEDEKKALG